MKLFETNWSEGRNANFVVIDREITHDNKSPIKLRTSQEAAYIQMADERFCLLNKPTGSGKSIDIQLHVLARLIRRPELKVLIVVPQLTISSSFDDHNEIEYPAIAPYDKGVYTWTPPENLCKLPNIDSSSKRIIEFLGEEPSNREGMEYSKILVTTHASLVKAFQRDKGAFKNVLLAVDEAHHIQFSDSDPDFESQNKMGEVVSALLDEESNEMFLATATFYRGDKLAIIPSSHIDKFSRFNLPYDDFFRDECRYIERFSYQFAHYNSNHQQALDDIFRDGVPNFIGYVPHVGSTASLGGKHKDVQAYYRAIAQCPDPKVVSHADGSVSVFRGSQEYRGVDLVDETDREQKKTRFINEAHQHEDGSKLDFIIALNMFKEGANWRWATDCVIIGYKSSLTDLMQSLGRLFRDAKGKSVLKAHQVIPLVFDVDSDKYWAAYNDYLKAILVTMLLEEVISPSLPRMKPKRGVKTGISTSMGILDYFDDENQYHSFRKILTDSVLLLTKKDLSSKEFDDKFIDLAIVALKNVGISQGKTNIAKMELKIWKSQTNRIRTMTSGMNVSDIDYDTISGMETIGWLYYIISNDFSVASFKELRDRMAVRDQLPLPIGNPELFKQWNFARNKKLVS
jgi:superfamily II DNA or RNA helicase